MSSVPDKCSSPIVIATSNNNKILEISAVAREYGIEVVSPSEISLRKTLGPPPKVDELGETYLENALLKAQAYAAWSGYPALGDDSGLEVLALDHRPGVYSARYCGEMATDAQRMASLVTELNQVSSSSGNDDRRAIYRSVLALTDPTGEVLTAEGTLSGTILFKPRGKGGFGYDPIVLIDELGQTLAEVDFSVTCKIGFRVQAARKLFSQYCEQS